MDAGDTLRILDEERFEVVWTTDGWQTTQRHAEPRPGQRGLQRGHCTRTAGASEFEWTLHWPEQDRLAWIQCESQD